MVTGLEIQDYLSAIINSAIVGYEKQNPKLFEEIYKHGDFEDYYMIGDSYNADIVGGQNFGLKTILVRSDNVNGHKNYSIDLDGIWQFID